MTVRRSSHAAFLAAAALSSTLACKFEPKTPEIRYSLNGPVVADLDGATQAQIAGALEMMFGTAADPGMLALPEWLDEGFDPNYWGEDQIKADEAAWAEVQTGNRRRFASQLTALEAGNWQAVKEPRFAWDLWARWQEEFLPRLQEKGLDEALKTELTAAFVDYYPTLRNSARFYRDQCYHCHGSEGGGNGSTSAFLNPRPRDYRPGKFKFTGQKEKAKPQHADLFRILAEGIYTTAMPSFRRFSDAELHGLVDYVRLLAVRGETEILLASDAPDSGVHFDNVKENYQLVVGKWREASEKRIAFEGEIPAETPERIEHGRALFMAETGANCIKCHGASGRGDGVSAFEVGKDPASVGSAKKAEYAKDDWGNQIVPRDLTRGVFRFGRRPIDLYRRIYAGINGTPMPEHFGMTITENGAQRTLNEDDLWDLVFFVRSLASHPAEHGDEHAPGPEGEHIEEHK
jgi:mono/diheme cytochrome c family protein